MKYPRARIGRALIEAFGPDDRRIEHALRVLRHAEQIADGRTDCDADVLIASALLHDIGIKLSEQKLGYNNGKTQEEYGPPEAERLLLALGFPPDKTEKVMQIIGNHHSPSRYDYPELAVLKEADAIVNRDDSEAIDPAQRGRIQLLKHAEKAQQ